MLINAQTSALLVVDIQERLLPAIDGGAALVEQAGWLVEVARRVGVPVLASEQYTKGLGPTVAQLRERLEPAAIMEKLAFSAASDDTLFALPGGDRAQFVVCGTETHVCVLQTVLHLLRRGRDVFVVAEAVGSRRPEDKALALERMRQAGAMIVSREMVAFEWMERAGTDLFRQISREFIR
ncbi:nicotinamidase/pyrazinamidase [compost metagenome]|uniref:Nicotinamidase-related amidase n=1 Tax=Pseudomonas jinjuensis TaxID=198616 RepID=A0A1H0HEZ1_9PSED|nr:hydrolase [Pseudomonas jinjuensis]SDO17421.1 Nicotinamidase-related amidase [Pseudomonas jinjuensis]